MTQGAVVAMVVCMRTYTALCLLVPTLLFIILGLLDTWHAPKDLGQLFDLAWWTAAVFAFAVVMYWVLAVWGRGKTGQSSLEVYEAGGSAGV